MRRFRWLGVLLAALVLTACEAPARELPKAPSSVGRLMLNLNEGENPEVRAAAEASSEDVILLLGQAEFETWFDGLPATVQENLRPTAGRIDLRGGIAVAGFYPQCKERSRVVSPAPGEVDFVVYIPEEDHGIVCAWSPTQLDVYHVPLADLGVTDPAEVRWVE